MSVCTRSIAPIIRRIATQSGEATNKNRIRWFHGSGVVPQNKDDVDLKVYFDPVPQSKVKPKQAKDKENQAPSDFHALFAKALKPFYKHQSAVVLRGVLAHSEKWKHAMDNWNDWKNYLQDRIGANQCFDVEMGRYNSGNERLNLPFGEYVKYLELMEEYYQKEPDTSKSEQGDTETNKTPEILYLAQNELPHSLLEDLEFPTVCTDATVGCGQGKMYHTMLWMGPRNATSPLHNDPMDNLLYQVVGRKRVTILAKSEEFEPQELCAGPDFGQQPNTSAIVDLNCVDYEKYPDFPPVEFLGPQEAILEPGDALYIPQRFWHSARSLDTSISINSWWR